MARKCTEQNGYHWEKLNPMPTKRVFSTPVVVNGVLHVVGGCDARGAPVDNLESCTPKKSKWSRLMNMPTPRAGVCCLPLGNKLMTFGGVNQRQEPTDTVEIYDVDRKSWTGGTKPDTMKEKVLGLSAVLRDDKAILVGGMGIDTNPKDYVMSYDVNTNKWGSYPAMPTPRYATFSFLIDDRLYVLGGRMGKVPVAAFEVYDFKENNWKKLPDIPSKRVFALYATDNDNRIFSLGGLNHNPKDGMSGAMETFDLRTEKWILGKEMPTKRGDFAVALLGNQLVAAGGLGNGGRPLATTEAYDFATDTWTSLPDMLSSHCSCAFTTFNDKLTVIGGLSEGGPSNAVDVLGYKHKS